MVMAEDERISPQLAYAIGGAIFLHVEREGEVNGHPTYSLRAKVRSFGWTISSMRYSRFHEFATWLHQHKEIFDGLVPEDDFPRQFRRQLFGIKLSSEELSERASALDRWFFELARLVRSRCVGRDDSAAAIGASAGLELLLGELMRFLRVADIRESLARSGALVNAAKGPDAALPTPESPKNHTDDEPLLSVDREVDHRRDAVSEQLEQHRSARKTRPRGGKAKRRSLSLRPVPTTETHLPTTPLPSSKSAATPRSKSLEPTPTSKALFSPKSADSAGRDLAIKRASYRPANPQTPPGADDLPAPRHTFSALEVTGFPTGLQ